MTLVLKHKLNIVNMCLFGYCKGKIKINWLNHLGKRDRQKKPDRKSFIQNITCPKDAVTFKISVEDENLLETDQNFIRLWN